MLGSHAESGVTSTIPEQQGNVHSPILVSIFEPEAIGAVEEIRMKQDCPVLPVGNSHGFGRRKKISYLPLNARIINFLG